MDFTRVAFTLLPGWQATSYFTDWLLAWKTVSIYNKKTNQKTQRQILQDWRPPLEIRSDRIYCACSGCLSDSTEGTKLWRAVRCSNLNTLLKPLVRQLALCLFAAVRHATRRESAAARDLCFPLDDLNGAGWVIADITPSCSHTICWHFFSHSAPFADRYTYQPLIVPALKRAAFTLEQTDESYR